MTAGAVSPCSTSLNVHTSVCRSVSNTRDDIRTHGYQKAGTLFAARESSSKWADVVLGDQIDQLRRRVAEPDWTRQRRMWPSSKQRQSDEAAYALSIRPSGRDPSDNGNAKSAHGGVNRDSGVFTPKTANSSHVKVHKLQCRRDFRETCSLPSPPKKRIAIFTPWVFTSRSPIPPRRKRESRQDSPTGRSYWGSWVNQFF